MSRADSAVSAAVGETAAPSDAKHPQSRTIQDWPLRVDDLADDRAYRSRAEVEAWKKKDPILRMQQYLQSIGLLNDARMQEHEARAKQSVDDATEFAKHAPYPKPEFALEQVWGELPK
jgi:2-oxoisovalerate dehydrogenase E1 component alpha subunit